MNTVVLPEALRELLGGGAAKVTLTDEAGRPVGHYLPDDLYRAMCDALVPPSDADRAAAGEELRRGEVATTAEVLAGTRDALRRWSGRP
jgi:hypothetical protein